MVSIPKMVGIISCGFVLCLGLSNATEAEEKPPAAERMKPDPSADRRGGLPGLVKINTVKGEVLRVEGANYIVHRFDGKEVSLHTDETTQMTGNIRTGDRIEARVNAQRHALSIRQAE